MPDRVTALSIAAAIALIGVALAAVPLTAGATDGRATAGPGCSLVGAALDPGYGISRVGPQSCDAGKPASLAAAN